MDINQECKEWIELFCGYENTDYQGLSEMGIENVIQWMKKDGFTEEQIIQAIENYEKSLLKETSINQLKTKQ